MQRNARRLHRLEVFLSSERGKRILNRFYSWGAAFVILGALFKLLHIRYGDEILLVSMLTEFVVFFISGFERPEKTYQWEKVYPELGEGRESDRREQLARRESLLHRAQESASDIPYTQSHSIEKSSALPINELAHLREAIDRLGEATDQLSRIGSVSGEMSQRYEHMALDQDTLSQHSTQYLAEMESLARNVTGLNAIYELQLKGISSQVETIDRINAGLQHIRSMYEGSLEGSTTFREQNDQLVDQLTQLNEVYARILQALTSNMGLPGSPHTPYSTSSERSDLTHK
ncbi:gliding motility protein GldL [Porphyromonas sp. oral taxon 278]|uniref:type IX secretion system motor protein PorL/GldL n=1 Tax=Porphyromonas sp. oral taxon 278 TaxID=712437 RepID=UPI0025FCFA79|nr:gliding motility protein GldL [Porphyromonas sp. oral taxon 278]